METLNKTTTQTAILIVKIDERTQMAFDLFNKRLEEILSLLRVSPTHTDLVIDILTRNLESFRKVFNVTTEIID